MVFLATVRERSFILCFCSVRVFLAIVRKPHIPPKWNEEQTEDS